MNCSASVVDGLVVLPDLTIVFPNSTVISKERTDSLAYMFSPLRMSDGGWYTCTAAVNIPVAGIILITRAQSQEMWLQYVSMS